MINPVHFAERHTLFVIISLGEALVAIGATASDVGLSSGSSSGSSPRPPSRACCGGCTSRSSPASPNTRSSRPTDRERGVRRAICSLSDTSRSSPGSWPTPSWSSTWSQIRSARCRTPIDGC